MQSISVFFQERVTFFGVLNFFCNTETAVSVSSETFTRYKGLKGNWGLDINLKGICLDDSVKQLWTTMM